MDAATAQPTKTQRINLRVTEDIKREIVTAAGMLNMTVSDFILKSSHERAEQVIYEAETITLDDASRDAFLDLLDNPPEPSDRLKALINENKKYLYL